MKKVICFAFLLLSSLVTFSASLQQDSLELAPINALIAQVASSKSLEERVHLLEKLNTDFPKWEKKLPKQELSVYSDLSRAYALSGKFEEAIAVLKKHEKSLRSSIEFPYFQIAVIAKTSKDGRADMALTALNRRHELLEKEKKQQKDKPEKSSSAAYIQQLTAAQQQSMPLKVMLLEDEGKNKEALKLITQLTRDNSKDSKNNETYTRLLEKCKDPLLYKALEDFVKQGYYTPLMKQKLQDIYHTTKDSSGFDDYFAELVAFSKEENKRNLAKILIDEIAPDFELKDLNGNLVKLKDLKGKVVVLDFWATWCVPCIASFPAMDKARKNIKKAEKNAIFLFISTGEKGTIEEKNTKVKNLITSKGFEFDVLLDSDNSVAVNYGIKYIPAKFVIDKTGRLRYKSTGGTSEETLLRELEGLVDLLDQ